MITRSVLAISALSVALLGQNSQEVWEQEFKVDKSTLVTTGTNPFFVLVPGFKSEFVGGDTRLVITVFNRTKKVDGVMTRIVEEREYEDGKVIEVSRNYFAIDPKTSDVYYFGEDVDMYKDGRVVSHEGAWLSGVKGAKFGLMMPGKPTVGRSYYQEIAQGVAMDRAVIVAADATVQTPSGTYRNCLRVEETTPLEPGVKEYKYYSTGVGLIQDSDLKLVKKS